MTRKKTITVPSAQLIAALIAKLGTGQIGGAALRADHLRRLAGGPMTATGAKHRIDRQILTAVIALLAEQLLVTTEGTTSGRCGDHVVAFLAFHLCRPLATVTARREIGEHGRHHHPQSQPDAGPGTKQAIRVRIIDTGTPPPPGKTP